MYRHILICIDGSAYALKAARHGLKLARSLSAMVSAIIVTPPWRSIALSEIALGRGEEQYDAQMAEYAERCLGKVRAIGIEQRIVCETVHAVHANPYEAILSAAAEQGCDLVVVGSHGRHGVSRLLLGSETSKILAHSRLPVLVYRE